MERETNLTEQKLFKAFMQFRKAEWHQSSIAGYTLSEIGVLLCIGKSVTPECPAMKVSEISKRLHVASPTITQLIKALEAHGLIERNIDPTDRRAVGITLTEQGKRVAQQAERAFLCSFHGLVEYLGQEQSDQLAELLFKVFRYFGEKAASENHAHWGGDNEV